MLYSCLLQVPVSCLSLAPDSDGPCHCRKQVGAAFSKDDPTPGIFQDHAEELTPEEELAGEQAVGCSLTRLSQLPKVAEVVAVLSSLCGEHVTSCQKSCTDRWSWSLLDPTRAAEPCLRLAAEKQERLDRQYARMKKQQAAQSVADKYRLQKAKEQEMPSRVPGRKR